MALDPFFLRNTMPNLEKQWKLTTSYTEISSGDKLQAIAVEAKPTCSLPVWM